MIAASVLAVGAVAPPSVRAEVYTLERLSTSVPQNSTASRPVNTVEPPAQSPRKKSGGFWRTLTSPFRAIAKFLVGDKNSAPEMFALTAGTPETAKAESTPVASKERNVAERKEQREAGATETRANNQTSEAKPVQTAANRTSAAPFMPYVEGVPEIDHLAQGRALLASGYVDEAIAELSIAATVGPNLIEANNLLGQAYDRRGNHKFAIECYERALAFAPKNPLTLNNLGYSLYMDDNYGAALKRLKQASRYAPNDPTITENVALVQFRLGKYDEAFKGFARISGDFEARVRLATMLEGVNRPSEAVRHYELALRLRPNSGVVLQGLAALYQRVGRTDKAEAARRTLTKQNNKPADVAGGG